MRPYRSLRTARSVQQGRLSSSRLFSVSAPLRCAQDRAADLRDADQEPGVRRPGSGLLRGALSRARAAGTVAARGQARVQMVPITPVEQPA